MKLREIRTILLAQAIEETDPEGEILPLSNREAATGSCKLDGGEGNFFASRAAALVEWLASRHAEIKAAATPLAGPRVVAVGVILLAAVSGFLSNKLGPEQRINILAFPLLGMLAWNFLVYLLEIVRAFIKTPSIGLIGWLHQVFGRRKPVADGPMAMGLTLFSTTWAKAAAPTAIARLRAVFHFAAAVFAATAVAGMYVDGLANEFLAIWQSTFLDTGAVQSLVNTILGPAAAVLGDPVPSVENMRWTAGNPVVGQNAAPWIHLYAVTIAIFIVAPRLALSASWLMRSAARVRAISVRDFAPTYFDRLLAEARGESISVRIVSHSHSPSEAVQKNVKDKLAALLGGPVNADWTNSIAFGEESEFVAGLCDPPTHLVLLLNFSVTPEEEIHGELVRDVRAKLEETDSTLWILLDASGFDEKRRAFPDFADRRKGREQAWRRLIEDDPKQVSVVGDS